jgi:hypothetical protein
MICALLAQSFPQPSATEFYVFMGCVMLIVGGIATFYKIRADKKRGDESNEPRRTILPSPLTVKHVEEFVPVGDFTAQVARRDKELREMEERLERRIDSHELLVRDRFHNLSNDVNGVAIEAKEGREVATEQFQKIEGRLGEVKSSLQHINATQTNVNRQLENLPETIAKAIERSRTPRR